MARSAMRPGETALPFDPARDANDARLIFIGRVRSPWRTLGDCPKNLREARERGGGACLEIDQAFRQGLQGLNSGGHIILLSWLAEARRDLITLHPRHAQAVSGVFALRAPLRPNPIAMDVVRLISIDRDAGILEIDAIDLLDGTPIVDLKPHLPSVDVPLPD